MPQLTTSLIKYLVNPRIIITSISLILLATVSGAYLLGYLALQMTMLCCATALTGLFVGFTLRRAAPSQPTHAQVPVSPLPTSGLPENSINCPRLTSLIQQQQDTYNNVFLANPTTFHQPTFHYDWWMFPVPLHTQASPTSRQYAVNNKDYEQLLQHAVFMQTYLSSIELYLQNLSSHGWNHYPIRFEKMLRSLCGFLNACTTSSSFTKNNVTQNKLLACASTAVAYAEKNNIDTGRIQTLVHQLKQSLAENAAKRDTINAYTPTFSSHQTTTPECSAGQTAVHTASAKKMGSTN